MDTNAQIISDLWNKIGPHQALDLLSEWKGVPVVIKGRIQEVREESVVFQVEPPDSICFAHKDKVMILHDVFIMGILGHILDFDLQNGIAAVGNFTYIDSGFGHRTMVRVEPEAPIPVTLVLDETTYLCHLIDISLNGFGLITEPNEYLAASKGQTVRISLGLLNREFEISGMLVGVFQENDQQRLGISFSQDAPNHQLVTHYISRRRVEIRHEIQTTYQQAVGTKH